MDKNKIRDVILRGYMYSRLKTKNTKEIIISMIKK